MAFGKGSLLRNNSYNCLGHQAKNVDLSGTIIISLGHPVLLLLLCDLHRVQLEC